MNGVLYLTFNYEVCLYQLTRYKAGKCITVSSLERQGTLSCSFAHFHGINTLIVAHVLYKILARDAHYQI